MISPELNPTDVSFTFLPQRPDTPANETRLRVFVADLDMCNPNFTPTSNPFGAGLLVTCDFVVSPTAPLGSSRVSGERSDLGDILGNQIPSSANFTDITVVQQTCPQGTECPPDLLCRNGICQPECPPLGTPCPDGTVCRTGACVPECPESLCPDDLVCQDSFCTSKCTQTSDCLYGLVCVDNVCVPPCTKDTDCPQGSVCKNGTGCVTGECQANTDCPVPARQACVSNLCVCGGDCNGDGFVEGNEIGIMVSIFGGSTPLASCPAGDINGDKFVEGNEIGIGVYNFGAGCP
jgi:hypothetical protein